MKWIEIEEFEKLYKVSESGEVYSVRRDKFLKSAPNSCGYSQIVLHNNGLRKSRTVHRLVAEAFIPNPENKQQVNHIDGNKQNNSVNNLEWCTESENKKHAYSIGLKSSRRGTDNNMCKLSEEEVLAIKEYKAKGKGPTEISRVMSLPLPRVASVYYGRSWGWLTHETI